MKQSSLELGTSTKRTRRREFLDDMDRMVPWSELVDWPGDRAFAMMFDAEATSAMAAAPPGRLVA